MLKLSKKADSLVVSYVLLVLISLSIAGMVYVWLKYYSDIEEIEKCPEEVSLNIIDILYNKQPLSLNLSLQNRGNFRINGFFIRVNNVSLETMKSGIYLLDTYTITINPGETISLYLNESVLSKYNKICLIEVQPAVLSSKNKLIPCQKTHIVGSLC